MQSVIIVCIFKPFNKHSTLCYKAATNRGSNTIFSVVNAFSYLNTFIMLLTFSIELWNKLTG